MYKLEIMPTDGGEDAALFAKDLGEAIAKNSNNSMEVKGTTVILHCI